MLVPGVSNHTDHPDFEDGAAGSCDACLPCKKCNESVTVFFQYSLFVEQVVNWL